VRVLNIVTSPRKDQSASRALVDAFLREYTKQADDVVVDTLDVWQEWLPEFDAETINAKYKGVSGEPTTPAEVTAWKKIRELASRFQSADRIVIGVPMWNFSFPYKLKQLIDLSCQRNMLFTFDGKCYGPSLDIEKAFVAFVRGQSDEAGFETVPQPGFQYLSGHVEFWLRFIGVREVVTLNTRTYVGWPCGRYDRCGQKEGHRTGKAILKRRVCADARSHRDQILIRT
jgi:FMN-dependent NADH-azoreductase